MENSYQGDVLQAPRKLTSMLNVLTILTFIGCGFAYLGALYSILFSKNPEKELEKFEEQREKLRDNPLINNIVDSASEVAKRSYEHRTELFISAIVFTTLCLVGALLMRRLKKNGFWMYVVGQAGHLVVYATLVGFSLIGGVGTNFSAVVALVFIILYATQLKYMR
jgi:hypothetical protein